MTQPGPAYPYPYTPPYRPPASIKTLGILNLVFGALGLLGAGFTWAMYFGHLHLGPRNPVVDIAHESPSYMSFLRWSLVLGLFAIVALLASGIGLLKMRLWGRKLAIVYAVWGIVSAIISLVVTQHYVLGPLSHSDHMAAGAGSAGGYVGGVLGMVYPVILLVFMTRRHVVEALVRASEPPVPPARVV